MKNKIFSLVMLAMAFVGLTACNDDNWNPGGSKSDEGTVSLASMDVDVNTEEDVVSRASVNTDAYLVEILNTKTSTVEGNYVYGEMPDVVTLPEGDYTVNVKSHVVKDADWSAPYYVGTKNFSVTAGKLTEIGLVTCKFSNIKVTIRYSADLLKLLGDDANVNVVANDKGSLDFKRDETRSGYFAAVDGSATLVAHLTATIAGNPIQAIKPFDDVAAGQHHIITFNVKNGSSTIPDEFGKIDPSGITIDATIEHEDIAGNVNTGEENKPGDNKRPGDEEWPDDPVTPGPGPDEPGPDQPGEEAIEFDGPGLDLTGGVNNYEEGKAYAITIKAPKGIENLQVNISSDNADFIGSAGELLPLTFDLAHVDDPGVENNLHNDLGLPVNAQVNGQSEVLFDVTGLVPLLTAFPGTHTFSIDVTDKEGAKKSMKLVIFVA